MVGEGDVLLLKHRGVRIQWSADQDLRILVSKMEGRSWKSSSSWLVEKVEGGFLLLGKMVKANMGDLLLKGGDLRI